MELTNQLHPENEIRQAAPAAEIAVAAETALHAPQAIEPVADAIASVAAVAPIAADTAPAVAAIAPIAADTAPVAEEAIAPLVPAEPHLPKPVEALTAPTPALPVPANDPFVSEGELKEAEGALATYLGDKLSAEPQNHPERAKLLDGLELTLKEFLNHGDKAGIELSFKSPQLTTNSALLTQEVNQALREHTLFARLFDSPATTPKATKAEPDVLQLQIGNLTVEQYNAIVDGLRGKAVAVPTGTAIVAPAQHLGAEKAPASMLAALGVGEATTHVAALEQQAQQAVAAAR